MRKTEPKNSYSVKAITTDNFEISKEIDAHNEWEAVLYFEHEMNYKGFYFDNGDYIIDHVLKTH